MPSLAVCLFLAAASASLDRGTTALSEFRVEEAISDLERARNEGPYPYADHVRLFEQIGIAYAYLDLKDRALEAFDMLLALDPGHALSYTLSPKVTFLFEQARKKTVSRPNTTVDLSWPRDLKVVDPVPIDVEVIADPKGLLKHARLHTRRKGTVQWKITAFDLPGPGSYERIELLPVHPDATGPQVLQLYLTVIDGRGNEVLLLGHAGRPREISIAYIQPESWYRKWWVWALVGGVVAAGTGTAVYLTTHEPPERVGGEFIVP